MLHSCIPEIWVLHTRKTLANDSENLGTALSVWSFRKAKKGKMPGPNLTPGIPYALPPGLKPNACLHSTQPTDPLPYLERTLTTLAWNPSSPAAGQAVLYVLGTSGPRRARCSWIHSGRLRSGVSGLNSSGLNMFQCTGWRSGTSEL